SLAATHSNYTRSLHDALPILHGDIQLAIGQSFAIASEADKGHFVIHIATDRVLIPITFGYHEANPVVVGQQVEAPQGGTEVPLRSEEHTSELQSRENLVCRLL